MVVEDEPSIRDGLTDVLTYRGYRAHGVADGRAALICAAQERFDLMLLDVMLPEVNGYEVCEQLRRRGEDLPIIMLTAKGAEEDIVRGLEAGADDYIVKPFSLKELLARVSAMLRRSQPRAPATFGSGPLTIDTNRSSGFVEDQEIPLTVREIAILRMLVEAPGRIVSRRTLLKQVWGMQHADQVETRTVDVHIAKLRKKLGSIGSDYLETVRGQGYRWQG
jgi:two-component system response regulator RegX3